MLLITIACCALLAVVLVSTVMLWGTPGEGLGLPLIAILSFSYLYLEQPLHIIWSERMDTFFTERQVAVGIAVPALMLACFVVGWFRGALRFKPGPSVSWDPRKFWSFGFGACVIGTLLLAVLIVRSGGVTQAFSGVHGSKIAYRENTAYLYDSSFWIISGAAMMLKASKHLQDSLWRNVVAAAFAALVYVYSVLQSSRGLTFAITAALLVSYQLARGRKPTIAQTAPVWITAGVVALLMVGYRTVLHLGESPNAAPTLTKALNTASDIDSQSVRYRTTGNEFVVHLATLETVEDTHKYRMGLDVLYAYTVHIIPRVLWPEKHFIELPGIGIDDIWVVTGIHIAAGSAPGIVADVYQNFGWLSPVFFYLLGWCGRRLYLHAQSPGNPLPACAYIMFCALSLNLFAQGVGAIYVPLPYSLAPVFLYILHRQYLGPRRRVAYIRGESGVLSRAAW